ncbi:hypothetical protein, partial [Paenibacillus elgii]|uniref:hypothetical protein n=1 Tax=Paenibacillus elgii TaxID=189691 RepID=UPI00203FD08B
KILNVFHSKIQSTIPIPEDLEKQFFESALGEFSLDLYELTYDQTNGLINEDLGRAEISLLGVLMHKAYQEREVDRFIKLNNLVGRDLSLTGTGDTKRMAMENLQRIAK